MMTNNLSESYKPMFDFNVNQKEFEETKKVLDFLQSDETPDGIRFTDEFQSLVNLIEERMLLCKIENEKLFKKIN